MARRYDQRTTTFSPDGRLFQVEYAMESVSNAGCVLGILAPGEVQGEAIKKADDKTDTSAVIGGVPTEDVAMADAPAAPTASTSTSTSSEPSKRKRPGVVLAAEKRVLSKLLDKEAGGGREKLHTINNNVVAGVAGITADSNTLVSLARNVAQGHLQTYNEDMPVEQLVRRICDTKQGYTQFGGQRPFGVSFLFAGHDPHYQFQLYASDPSGNYSGWKANCIGANNSTAQSLLRQDYKDDFGIDEALALAVKVLSKTMDSTTLDSEKVEIATLTTDEKTGKPVTYILDAAEVDALLEQHGVAKKPEDA